MEKFANSLEHFKPVDGQPSGTKLTRIREVAAPLLLKIPYDKTGAVNNLIGLIGTEAAYSTRHSSKPRGWGHTMQQ